MECLGDIALPATDINFVNDDCEDSTSSTKNVQSPEMPKINTDDLPISLPKSKKWLNNSFESQESPKTKFTLNTSPVKNKNVTDTIDKMDDSDRSGTEEATSQLFNNSSPSIANTDNLLDINIPKITLLGREQAKKRLHAFSMIKQNSLATSPLSKKTIKQPKFLLQVSEESYNENGEKIEEKMVIVKKPPKKGANREDKAKAVIEEIEEMKKIENAYIEALEQGYLDYRNKDKRQKSRSRSRDRYKERRSLERNSTKKKSSDKKARKSYEKPKYPKNWAQFKERQCDFENPKQFKSPERKKDGEIFDFRKQLLFQSPSASLNSLTVKGVNNQEKLIPAEYIRFTVKNPTVSYSVNHSKVKHDCYTRKSVLEYVPRTYREFIKKIANQTSSYRNNERPKEVQKWFPKSVLCESEGYAECEILEPSLGLSILKSYEDMDDDYKDDNSSFLKEDHTERKADSKREEICTNSDCTPDRSIRKKRDRNYEKPETIKDVKLEPGGKLLESMKVDELEQVVENAYKILGKTKTPTKLRRSRDKQKHKKVQSKKRQSETKKAKKSRRKSKSSSSEEDTDSEEDESHNRPKEKHKDSRSTDSKNRETIEGDESNRTQKEKQSNKTHTKESKVEDQSKRKRHDKTSSEKEKHKEKFPEIPKNKKNEIKTPDYKCRSRSRERKTDSKSDSSAKQPKEKQDDAHLQQTESKEKIKDQSSKESKDPRRESKNEIDLQGQDQPKNKDRNKERKHKVKCVAESEFGTPDTDEYHSNWESDVDSLKSEKLRAKAEKENSKSWDSDEESGKPSAKLPNKPSYFASGLPLEKSPFHPPREIFPETNRNPHLEKSPCSNKSFDKKKVHREKSFEKSPIRNKSPETFSVDHWRGFLRQRSPEKSPRNRSSERRLYRDREQHSPFEDKPMDRSPAHYRHNERSPLRHRHLNLSPIKDYEDRSPLRSRGSSVERRPRRSPDRLLDRLERIPLTSSPLNVNTSSPQRSLEMPLNIRTFRRGDSYSRNKWEENRSPFSRYDRSPEQNFYNSARTINEDKRYALFSEDSWEKDDYTVLQRQYEERRLEEERLQLIEERRKLEIEKKQLEELEKQRYYSNMSDTDRFESADRYGSQNASFQDEERFKNYRQYGDKRFIEYYGPKSSECDTSRKSSEARRTGRSSYSPKRKSADRSSATRQKSNEYYDNYTRPEASPDGNKVSSHKGKDVKTKKSRWENFDISKMEDDQNESIAASKSKEITLNESKEPLKENKSETKHQRDKTDNKKADEDLKKAILPKLEGKRSESQGVKSYSKDRSSDKHAKDKKAKVCKEKFVMESKALAALGDLNLSNISSSSDTPSQLNSTSVFSISSVQKPELLENEYEKFMQAVSFEILPSQDTIKKIKESSVHSKEPKEITASTKSSAKKDVEKRKQNKKIKEESSSSSSSSSSDSDSSSSDSSSSSSSSDSSADYSRKRKGSKSKMNEQHVGLDVKVKQEASFDKPRKGEDVNKFLEVNKFEMLPAHHEKTVDQSLEKHKDYKRLSSGELLEKSLNSDRSGSKSCLDNIPLPKSVSMSLSFNEIPLPVPSPSTVSLLSDMEQTPKTVEKEDTLSVVFDNDNSEISALDTVTPVSADASFISPTKRGNLIPIKFLTAESRTQANTSIFNSSVGVIETKDVLTSPLKSSSVAEEEAEAETDFEKVDEVVLNRKRHFACSTIVFPPKKQLLDNSALKLNDDDSNSADFTEKLIKKEEAALEKQFETDAPKEAYEQNEVEKPDDFQKPKIDLPEMGTRHLKSPIYRIKPDDVPSRKNTDEGKDRGSYRSVSPKRKRSYSPGGDRNKFKYPRGREISPRRKDRAFSPRRRDRDPPAKRKYGRRRSKSPRRPLSPRRREPSPRRTKRNVSPRRRSLSPRKRSTSPKRMDRPMSPRKSRNDSPRRDRSISPIRRNMSPGRRSSPFKRNSSPSRRSSLSPYRRMSPDRGINSPRRKLDRSSRSPSRDGKRESIQETLQRLAGMDSYSTSSSRQSPIHSPLDGFKRSVADSTISDDQLLQRNVDEYIDSPGYNAEYYQNPCRPMSVISQSSPKRLSLDERINLALGLEKEAPKSISTTYDQQYNYGHQYYEQYYQNYPHCEQDYYHESIHPSLATNAKVVQVGNVLEVVPTEEISHAQPVLSVDKDSITSTQKIVQVGNMLQIVPTPFTEEKTEVSTSIVTSVVNDPLTPEILLKQQVERRAERESRRQEREKKRRDKERKRKEREKRKQMKLKMKTEANIKRALLLESEETEEVENENTENVDDNCIKWPPVPIIISNNLLKPPGKGILSNTFKGLLTKITDGEGISSVVKRKSVTFADGVIPGEGTSPSGGEELSSPPPPSKKLPKEKRFKKTKVPKKVKIPKKKKVKVKVIRRLQSNEDDDEEDNLPPPPPPPGSPPTHVFPPRIKNMINNLHPSLAVNIVNPPPPPNTNPSNYQSLYMPALPVSIPHHHPGPPHHPVPHNPHHPPPYHLSHQPLHRLPHPSYGPHLHPTAGSAGPHHL